MNGIVGLVVVAVLGATTALADPVLPLPRVPVCGDQGESSLRDRCSNFQPVPDLDVVPITASGSMTQLLFDLVLQGTDARDEFGYFTVDDATGSLGGLQPGDPGYLAAALAQAVVIFPAGSAPTATDVSLDAPPGWLVPFIVRDGTLAGLLTDNPENLLSGSPRAFFSLDVLNPDGGDHFVAFRKGDETQLAFENTIGGDGDYGDVVVDLLDPGVTNVYCVHDGNCVLGTCDRGMRKCVRRPFPGPYCGDQRVDGGEQCDGSRGGCARFRQCSEACRCEGDVFCGDDRDVDGKVAVLFVPPQLDRDRDGIVEPDLREVARQFYCSHPDDFQFLTVLASFPEEEYPGDAAPGLAYYRPVKNEVRGIGPVASTQCCFDFTEDHGSATLEGVVGMHSAAQWRAGSTTEAVEEMGRQLAHRWCCYARFQRPDDPGPRSDLLSADRRHWSVGLDSGGSVLGGEQWKSVGSSGSLELFRSRDGVGRYSPLDLYLMGLLPPNKVPPFFLIAAPTITETAGGLEVEGTRLPLTIDDVVRGSGPREPAVRRGRTVFRQAFILLVPEGTDVPPDDVEIVKKIRSRWKTWFARHTRGRGRIDASLR